MNAQAAFRIGMKIKDMFFDRAAVLAKVNPAKRQALSKAGAFVRTRARSVLKRRKGASAPGQPPNIHSPASKGAKRSAASLRYILFGFDGQESVIVGPVGLNQRQFRNGEYRAGTVPELLEFGGIAGVAQKLENLNTVKSKPKRRKGSGKVLSAAQLAAIIRKRKAKALIYEAGTVWIPMGRGKPLPGQPTRIHGAKYEPRPYMSLALRLEKASFEDVVASSISAAAA